MKKKAAQAKSYPDTVNEEAVMQYNTAHTTSDSSIVMPCDTTDDSSENELSPAAMAAYDKAMDAAARAGKIMSLDYMTMDEMIARLDKIATNMDAGHYLTSEEFNERCEQHIREHYATKRQHLSKA